MIKCNLTQMDIIRTYLTNVNKSTQTNMVDSYKIVTVNDKSTHSAFLLYDHESSVLNSQTLMKLLMLKLLPYETLNKLLDNSTPEMKKITDQVELASSVLYEDRIFFNFDPYCNFLLNNNSTKKDIRDIINKTTTYQHDLSSGSSTDLLKHKNKECDYSKRVNPYGYDKVVFTGGGTKGIIYVGAILGLLTTGQLFYLNHFGGTSVGALTAMMAGCLTPSANEYGLLKNLSLRSILNPESSTKSIVTKYQKAVSFATQRLCKRNIDTFYTLPSFTIMGVWSALDTVAKNNGLYDPQTSGFQVWYALICKKICCIMENNLAELIVIKKKDGTIVDDLDIEKIDTESFDGWTLVRFFTFEEHNKLTDKTIVLTGTHTDPVRTVYYTHTNDHYKNISVIECALASMSIPWVFKAPIINGSYNLDGGIFDNYPLTHCDKKLKDKITHYNNRIFGYLIDDGNTIIDAYEVIRELWIVYNGFMDMMNICYMSNVPNYNEILELFFEIRYDVYKLLYFTDIDLDTFLNTEHKVSGFNISDLKNIFDAINKNNNYQLKLCTKGVEFVESNLRALDSHYEKCSFKVGKKTDIANIMELSVKQGEAYNALYELIVHDLTILEKDEQLNEPILIEYLEILRKLITNILVYYELKGNFIKRDDLEEPTKYFSEVMENLHKKISLFETLTETATKEINKKRSKDNQIKNYIKNSVHIALVMINKVLTRGSSNDLNTADENKSSYMKLLDHFFHTDMTGILYKYMCIANDRICNDSFNRMRTIKLNTFETKTLHFGMDDELKARLIYEGYSKTIKHFTSLLHIMEITDRKRSEEEYLESFELRYKNSLV